MKKLKVSLDLLESFVDSEQCWFDHHGGCQAHGYLSLQPGERCPQYELKKIIAKHHEKEEKRMSKSLANMTVTEAASKALEILLTGTFDEKQERYKEKGYDWYDPNASWEKELREEYELDEDDDFSNLADIQGAWQAVKYEGGKYSRDGLTAERVAEYGGEGDGDQYWVVISITDGLTTRHFRKDGWYASYDGGYLDGDTSEVKPREKTITVFE